MAVRPPLFLSLLIVGGMVGASIWAWPQIPAGAAVAVHWGFDNRANGFASRGFALLFAPCVAAFITALFAAAGSARGLEPSGYGPTAFEVGWIGALLVTALAHVLVILTALGRKPDIAGNVVLAIGLLFTFMGNFLGRTRPNPFVGVRTYWSLRSDYAWDKSNRSAGRMFVVVGVATLAALAIGGVEIATGVLIAGTLLSAFVSIALSYHYWKHDPARRP